MDTLWSYKNDTKYSNLGDIVMQNRGKHISLFFLGAQKSENNTWKVHFNLHKIKDKSNTLWEELEYSFDIYLDLKVGDELEFADDFGEYKYREVDTGFLRTKIERVQEFVSYSTIKVKELKKDEIVLDLKYV